MADIKIYNTKELIKMSQKDLMDLASKLYSALAHQKLRVRTNEDKQSHKVKKYKRQIARIQTISNQMNDEK